MELSNVLTLTGIVTLLIASVVVVFAAFRTNTAKVWKEEAEAQKARADRLEGDLTEIKERLKRIQRDNDQLFQLLTALDPTRMAALRAHYPPPEV